MVRAFFIDGPDHGTTRTFESEPPREWLTAGDVGLQAYLAEPTEPTTHWSMPTHRYVRTYKTRRGVWIYEYDGTTT